VPWSDGNRPVTAPAQAALDLGDFGGEAVDSALLRGLGGAEGDVVAVEVVGSAVHVAYAQIDGAYVLADAVETAVNGFEV
jgi:hypothetical protein